MAVLRALAPDDSLEALTALLHLGCAPLAAMGLDYTAVGEVTQDGLTHLDNQRCAFHSARIAQATEHWASAATPLAWRTAAAIGPGCFRDGRPVDG